MKSNILIVDDQEGARVLIKDYLSDQYNYFEAEDKLSCLTKLKEYFIDAVILDLKIPGVNEFDLLIEIRKQYPHIPVIILTSFAEYSKAVDAIKLGAFDFMPKEEAEQLLLISIKKILQASKAMQFNQAFKEDTTHIPILFKPNLPSYQKLFNEINAFAQSDLNILLLGETGTGKDMIAQYIHQQSSFKGAFVRVDCGELDATFLRSELFGHERGSFTGAETQRIGKIELANDGTLFLDEIGNLSMDLQSKFLTVLEKKRIERIGSNKSVSVNFRLISATNIDLQKSVDNKKFRADLYYRLKEVELVLPTLRDNKETIIPLVNYFLEQLNEKYQSNISFNIAVIKRYLDSYWPGNIRELKSCVKKNFFTLLYGKENIENSMDSKTHINMNSELKMIERTNIENSLKEHQFNITKAAQFLNIKRQCLQYKIKKYNIKLEK